MIEVPKQSIPFKNPQKEVDARAYAENYLTTNFPGITFEDVLQQNRTRTFKVPRHELIVDLSSTYGMGVMEIRELLQRDHSTIHHAIHKPLNLRQRDLAEWKAIQAKKAEAIALKMAEARRKEQEVSEKENKEKRNAAFIQITLNRVANHYGVKLEEITGPRIKKRFTQPRKTAQYIMFKGTNFSLKRIAEFVGRFDHSTALNAIKKVETRLEHDEEFKERVESLQEEINTLTERFVRLPQSTS